MSGAKGKQIAKHHAPGELTLQCLSGRVEISLPEATRELGAGDLLYLKAGTEHALRGLEDALLLLTIAV
jgi:quercetin dioxygenase-like cupin family protein